MYKKCDKLWVRVLVTVGNYMFAIVLTPLMIMSTLIKVTYWKIFDRCDIGYLEALGINFEGMKQAHSANMKYLKGDITFKDYLYELDFPVIEEDEEEEEEEA